MLSWTVETNIIRTSFSDSGNYEYTIQADHFQSFTAQVNYGGDGTDAILRTITVKDYRTQGYSNFASHTLYMDTISTYSENFASASTFDARTVDDQRNIDEQDGSSLSESWDVSIDIFETVYGNKSSSISSIESEINSTLNSVKNISKITLAFSTGKAMTTTKSRESRSIKTTTTYSSTYYILDSQYSYQNTVTTQSETTTAFTTYFQIDSTYKYPNQPPATVFKAIGETLFSAKITTGENFIEFPGTVSSFTDVFQKGDEITAIPVAPHAALKTIKIGGYDSFEYTTVTLTTSWSLVYDSTLINTKAVRQRWFWTSPGDDEDCAFPIGLSSTSSYFESSNSLKKTTESFFTESEFAYPTAEMHGWTKRSQLVTTYVTYKDTLLTTGKNPFIECVKITTSFSTSEITANRGGVELLPITASSGSNLISYTDDQSGLDDYFESGATFETFTMDGAAGGLYSYTIPILSTPVIQTFNPAFVLFSSDGKLGVYDNASIKGKINCNQVGNINLLKDDGCNTYSVIYNREVVSLIEKFKGQLGPTNNENSTANVSFNNKTMFIFNNFKNTTSYIPSKTVSYNYEGEAGRGGSYNFSNPPNIIGGTVLTELDGFGVFGLLGLNNYFLSNGEITKFEFPKWEIFQKKETFTINSFRGAYIALYAEKDRFVEYWADKVVYAIT